MNFDTQQLIDSGMAWRLEGHVGRECMRAIEQGFAVLGPEAHRDFYGNRVPSRHEVVPGTKGSVEYALARLDELEARGVDVDDARDRIDALRGDDA